MIHKKHNTPILELRLVQRQRIQQSLAIAAIAAFILSSCNQQPDLDETANEPIDAVFYENTQQCEADIKQQNRTYQSQLAASQRGELKQPPVPPVMKVEDCALQILAARQEYEKTAPLYANAQDCQAEGVKCEAVNQSASSGYRPAYGGTYFSPYNDLNYSYVNYGGYYRRVYATHPVYASQAPGQVITPFGRTVTKTVTGRVNVPRHTTFQAPQRPPGTSGRGTISGRSKQGFGSMFRSTGRGGK